VSYAGLSARRFTVAAIVTRREGIGGPTPVESVATVAPLLGQKATERPRARHLTEATNSSGLSSSKHAPDQRFMGHLHAVVGERHQARLSQPLKDHLDGLGASAGHQLSPPHAPAGVLRSVSERREAQKDILGDALRSWAQRAKNPLGGVGDRLPHAAGLLVAGHGQHPSPPPLPGGE